MIPKPDHVWYLTGSWPFSVHGVLAEQVARECPGFSGPGWYEQYRILVESTGTTRDNRATYRVSRYAADPRADLAAAAALPTHGVVTNQEIAK